MILFWLGLFLFLSVPLAVVVWLWLMRFHLQNKYLHHLVRIFQEKPLFVVPRGQPVGGAVDVSFPTRDGLSLRGCYLKTKGTRRGVIFFVLEFGSNRWSCVPYCQHLIDAGYDVFAFELRNQGDSEHL